MLIILASVATGGAILVWIVVARGAAREPAKVDTKRERRRPRSALEGLVGRPLDRVKDVRLAAVILMIQIVRTGSPITSSEKTQILEFMEEQLAVDAVSALFETAWAYTEARRPFSLVADELLPLLRDRLTAAERRHLVDMLLKVAGAHSAPSDLQRQAIARLERRLGGGSPALKTSRAGDFGR